MERPLSLSSRSSADTKQDKEAAKKQHLLAQAWRRYRSDRMTEAKQFCLQILFLDARYSGALHLLGLIAHKAGQFELAVKIIRRAIAVNAKHPAYHIDLGNALVAQKDVKEAAACYKAALALQPDATGTPESLCGAFQSQDEPEEAVDSYRRALALKPDLPEAHCSLGFALFGMGSLDDAAVHCQKALDLMPDYPEAHNNLGIVFHSQGKLAAALGCFERALTLKPDYAEAHRNRSTTLLLQGNFASGWEEDEWRWKTAIAAKTPMRPYTQPLWRGENLTPRRILLWGEQGIGDEIMFAGLFRDALGTGNRCVVDCDSRLVTLFARSFPEIQVVSGLARAQSLDAVFAAHAPSGNLPALFRSSESAFAAATSPYLKPDSMIRNQFRAKYADGRPLIGIAWQTNNRETGRARSIDLSLFASLLSRPDLRFVSLQYGDFDSLENQAHQAHVNLLIDRTVDQLTYIDRFAAQVAAMDMVISIDNSTAHLAGALGVPVWVLLPHLPEWRWMLDREDSPWYPTMRLFRQPRPGDWKPVVARVQEQLGTLSLPS